MYNFDLPPSWAFGLFVCLEIFVFLTSSGGGDSRWDFHTLACTVLFLPPQPGSRVSCTWCKGVVCARLNAVVRKDPGIGATVGGE